MTDFKFKAAQRVRLKHDVAELYRRAFGGSEGFVRGRKKDSVGFPMILVEWDKDHWTYNGEEDMWTFEEHFEAVEELTMPSINNDDDNLADALINFLKNWKDESGEPDHEDDSHEDTEQQYYATAREATESVEDGEAFMIFTVKRQQTSPDHPEQFILVPEIFSAYQTEEAGLLLETQLSQVAAVTQQEMAGALLAQIMQRRRENGGD